MTRPGSRASGDGPPVTLLAPDSFRRTPWKNGGGVAIDIADAYRPGAEPGSWSGMLWRFGRTRIAVPAPFSDLSGHDRIIAVVEGCGLVLLRSDGTTLDLREPFRPVRFPGEWALSSELGDGPVEVVNLIGARSWVDLDLRFSEGTADMPVGPGEHVAYAVLGDATIEIGAATRHLPGGHAARFRTAGPIHLHASAGRIALASVRDVAGP